MPYNRILLIDDDEDDREFFVTAVNQLSTSVSCETSSMASEALQKLKSKDLKPDVIFLDLNMPVMNGQQFLVEIKKHPELKIIPIVVFSTSSHSGTIQLMMELGAENFITKPDSFDKLLHILKPMLNKQC